MDIVVVLVGKPSGIYEFLEFGALPGREFGAYQLGKVVEFVGI